MRIAHTRDSATFDQAFEAARGAGADEFVWQGNRYHTRRADEEIPREPPVIVRIEETDQEVSK